MNLVPITFETLYAAVGEAISTWAQVEEALAILFAMSVTGTDLGHFDPEALIFARLNAHSGRSRLSIPN